MYIVMYILSVVLKTSVNRKFTNCFRDVIAVHANIDYHMWMHASVVIVPVGVIVMIANAVTVVE